MLPVSTKTEGFGVAVFMGEWGGGYAGGCSAVNVKEI